MEDESILVEDDEYISVDVLELELELGLEVVSVIVVESSLASIAKDEVFFCSFLFMWIFSSSGSAGNKSGWTK